MNRKRNNGRFFRRRLWNIANLVYSGGFLVLLGVSWLVFMEMPHLGGAFLTLAFLAMAAVNLAALVNQVVSVTLDEEWMEVRYLFMVKRVPYNRIERLHWQRRRHPLGGFRPRDVLKIELKDGKWIVLDFMRGRLKHLRGILENRIYC